MPSPATFAPKKFLGLFFGLEFIIMIFPPKIDIIYFQDFRRFRASPARFVTDMSQWRVFSHVILVHFFTIRLHLDHSHNQNPQNARYQNSKLKGLANIGSYREAGCFQAESVLIYKYIHYIYTYLHICIYTYICMYK